MANPGTPTPWWQIIAILVVFAVAVGVVIGLLSTWMGFSASWGTAGVGAATGVLAATLISRRNRSNS